jgi:hypothetical protein
VVPHRIVDPTGVGDAFRGGLMKGLALGLPSTLSARLGSVAATYALEHLGGQSHAYTWDEFRKRYEEHSDRSEFRAVVGRLQPDPTMRDRSAVGYWGPALADLH